MRMTRWQKRLCRILLLIAAVCLSVYLLQRFFAHRTGRFVPTYPQVALTEETDPKTLLLQTGLGSIAAGQLDLTARKAAQQAFFAQREVVCTPLLGWFTREDRLANGGCPPATALQPGDILITLSTHSAGWRHGHAALVIDADTTLEATVWGSNSSLASTRSWHTYSGYAVLRVKGSTPELRQQVVQYSLEHLLDVPYHLSAGWIGPKAPAPQDRSFGVQCSYLVWYAWMQHGYDLDRDGGGLVTSHDLLASDQLEVVQVFGMDPQFFVD